MNIINMTPHTIVVGDRKIPSSGCIRLSQTTIPVQRIDGIELVRTKYGTSELPEEKDDTLYIVSLPVAQYGMQEGRKDFVIPNDLVRDENGRVIGCKNLAFIS